MIRRAGVMALLGMGVLAAAVGLGRLKFDPDVLSMLPPDLPEVQGLRAFQDAFAEEGELVVLLEGSAEDAGLLGEEAASLATALEGAGVAAKARWQPQWSEEGEGLGELLAYLWINGPHEPAAEMAERFTGGRAEGELAAAVDRVATAMEGEDLLMRAHDPFGFLEHPSVTLMTDAAAEAGGGFESADGRGHLLLVEAPRPIHGYKEAGVWLEEVREVTERWKEEAGSVAKIRFTGEPAFSSEIGGAMESDMSGTVGITALLIGLLFWRMQRSLALLAGLIGVLAMVFVVALGLAGWIYGELSIMAAGFAAILIGLTVDYGVLICQEAKLHSGDRNGLTGATCKSILWAAATTAAVFLALNRSGLPGIAQLGTMVACGILAGAVLMLGAYLPFVARVTRKRVVPASGRGVFPGRKAAVAWVGVIFAISAAILGWRGLPPIEFDSGMMRPRNSEAMAAFESVQGHFPAWKTGGPRLIIQGNSAGMAARLAEAERRLGSRPHLIANARLPVHWWPDGSRQNANRMALSPFVAGSERLLAEADRAGFTSEGLALGRSVFEWLRTIEADGNLAFPQSPAAAEMMRMFVSREANGGGSILAPVEFAEGVDAAGKDYQALRKLTGDGIWLAGWDLLRPAVQPLVQRDLIHVFLPMAALMVVMLVMIFRSLREAGLILAAMALAGVALLAIMSGLGIGWNFINIAATPLLLGTGIDYGIHVMLALRRNDGDLSAMWRGTGKAVLFCGASTAIGFGSLCFASNDAMASLGAVAVIGILLTMATSVFLLPAIASRVKEQAEISGTE